MNDFNEAMFKTKVDNIFVKLYTCIMKGDLTDIKHFISNEIYDKYTLKINELTKYNQRQMYDEINVKNTNILERKTLNDKEVVKVELISRYMDYIINLDNGNLVSGDDTRRIEKRNILIFEKKIDTKEISIVRKCPGCGASIDVNHTGKCEYCDTIFNEEDYDYILVEIN